MSKKSKALEFANEEYSIEVHGRHVQVTDAMKNYAIEKISKLERFFDRIIEVRIVMDIVGVDYIIDMIVKVNDIRIKVRAVTGDMYASLDKAIDKLLSRVRRYKERINDHHARSVSTTDMAVNIISSVDPLDEINDAIDEQNQEELTKSYHHEIVSQETQRVKTLTQEEALMKMELSRDSFLVYHAEEEPNQSLRVIYRREDGNFGILQPE